MGACHWRLWFTHPIDRKAAAGASIDDELIFYFGEVPGDLNDCFGLVGQWGDLGCRNACLACRLIVIGGVDCLAGIGTLCESPACLLLGVLFVQLRVGVERMELIRLAWWLNDLTCQA